MPDLRHIPALLTWGAALLLFGCGKQAPPPSDAAPERVQDQVARAPIPAENPDDPALAARRFTTGLADNQIAVVRAAFPERYRNDLNSLLNAWLGPIDPDTRKAAAEAVANLAEVLASKETFVLGSERFALEGAAAEFVRERFAPLARVIAATARWEGWANAEGPALDSLLSRLAAAIAAEPALANDLRQLRFETKERQAERAILLIRSDRGTDFVELPLVRVEGRWMPEPLAHAWDELVARGNEVRSSEIADRDAHARELTLRVREITAGLAAVSTQADFEALAERAAAALLAAAAPPVPAARTIMEDEFVTVTVLGSLAEEEKDRLVWELASRTDEPSNGLADAVDRPGDGGFVVTVGPVSDVENFARRQPGLIVESVDPKTKAITARVGRP